MILKKARETVVETGRELLESGLVARTWGNVSCRIDDKTAVITPSGLDYTRTAENDIVTLNIDTGQWEGNRKPSGEKGVHIAAYQIFKDVNFVIHTHQTYATAISLTGFDTLDITDEEHRQLGGIGIAEYGLSGTKKLTNAVRAALSRDAKTILMKHHGALICGKDKEEAMERALLLEAVCCRNMKGQPTEKTIDEAIVGDADDETERILDALKKQYAHVEAVRTLNTMDLSKRNNAVAAQLDDMAQMVGRKIPVVTDDIRTAQRAAAKHKVILIRNAGGIVRADTEDDLEAMKLLLEKTAITRLHTDDSNKDIELGRFDCRLMHFIYEKKYSKQKNK